MLPFAYSALEERFATIRPWAKTAIGEATNRCAICMGYTLRLTPSEDDATVASLTGAKASFFSAPGLRGAPVPVAFGGAAPRPLSAQFFIRASELLPRVLRAYGKPDVQGVSNQAAKSVIGRKGVLYLENCYQTPGDKRFSFPFLQRTTGDHWDLFNGAAMVAEGLMISGNNHEGQLYFWQAR